MLKTVLVMATVALIACAAGVVIFEYLTRGRPPQVGPSPRRRAF
jgi:hypothetical protein